MGTPLDDLVVFKERMASYAEQRGPWFHRPFRADDWLLTRRRRRRPLVRAAW